MSERITKVQFASRANHVTQIARRVGTIGATDWMGTAVAWSMSYVCVFDVNGNMVRSLSRPMPTRGLYEYLGAMYDTLAMAEAVGISVKSNA